MHPDPLRDLVVLEMRGAVTPQGARVELVSGLRSDVSVNRLPEEVVGDADHRGLAAAV